ncbi:tetratricopeptide repeat-containing sensor histidine kinase [Flavobacterium cerinum]|uniref:Histidine kinase n=1 Tax=Flavobacterium cerinum TaxID=2502784 RepID=A0ABY5IUY4_9FLAO|nr:histidine kinase [Flavobacterium cerinum]UUC46454.1 histidine kinase [Flavobacterium cerinum]
MRNIKCILIVLGILLLFSQQVTAQSVQKESNDKSANVNLNKAAEELAKSLEANDEIKIAGSYEKLAQEFIEADDLVKAEEYLKKALESFTKLKKKEDIARISRSLARVQENQRKNRSALSSNTVVSKKMLNKNVEPAYDADAKFKQNAESQAVQYNTVPSPSIQQLEKEKRNEEIADAYVQKAEMSLQQKDKTVAIENYNQAISYVKDKPEEVIKLKAELAKVYTADNQFEEAIAISEKLLAEARTQKDFDTEIVQLQSLATVYFKKKEPKKAEHLLKEAYALATEKGKAAEVKKSMEKLLDYYRETGNYKESTHIYEQFFKNFEELLRKDSAQTDKAAFLVTEEKIRQLEKEKVLKDELIAKKNTFNYFLIGSMMLLLLLFGLIVKALYSIKTKNKEIALQSLRREMNPHFIFNSLNSVNQFISQNRELEANKYLTSYSKLMRNMMENSNKDFITLGSEIEQLRKYLDLEHMRFEDQFDYTITVDEKLDTETIQIPNMIIQPHLENAIWHGLRYKEGKGLLELSFSLAKGNVVVVIRDNGIGLTKSQELKTKNQKVHQSRGLTNTKERISLLNELYKKEITLDIAERANPDSGVIVTLHFPLIEK